jgi:hypothetical protein
MNEEPQRKKYGWLRILLSAMQIVFLVYIVWPKGDKDDATSLRQECMSADVQAYGEIVIDAYRSTGKTNTALVEGRAQLIDERRYQIYEIDQTSAEIRLTDGFHPVWSPDGKQIAYVSGNEPAGPDIFVMNADGSCQRTLSSSMARTSILPGRRTAAGSLSFHKELSSKSWLSMPTARMFDGCLSIPTTSCSLLGHLLTIRYSSSRCATVTASSISTTLKSQR